MDDKIKEINSAAKNELYDTKNSNTGITSLLQLMREKGLKLKDLKTEQSTLENIFINLVKGANNELVRH